MCRIHPVIDRKIIIVPVKEEKGMTLDWAARIQLINRVPVVCVCESETNLPVI